MIKLLKNKLASSFIILICIFILASLIPALRSPAFLILKLPLKLSNLIGQEVNAVVYYHRNFAENSRLKKENDALRARVNIINELYLENNRLKDLLSFKQGSAYKLLAARVIGRDPENWASIVIIDKGSSSALKENQLVITGLGVAGKIVEVGIATSKVMLINDPHINIPVITQRARQDGIVVGALQKNLIMKFLAYDADINIGDAVVTSGLDEVYPKGILVGRVAGFTKDPTGLSRYATVEPMVNVNRLEEILVVLK
ncbi:MAG: rod shape-determining protein MreC [Candidatus Omnitrophica bacterium]|nr:rod shape-determining protein MreC [Candidatus Omnitrophota bacterium]MDD5610046.1 rod shape-determining protein MreC [Candidatus Omnitrophota bacterium]